MKILLSTAVALLLAFAAHAQIYIDGKEWDSSGSGPYIEIVPLDRIGNTACNVVLDYGQEQRRMITSGNFLTDSKGGKLEFRSPIEALNYMYSYGWELVQVYTFDELRRYVLRRGK